MLFVPRTVGSSSVRSHAPMCTTVNSPRAMLLQASATTTPHHVIDARRLHSTSAHHRRNRTVRATPDERTPRRPTANITRLCQRHTTRAPKPLESGSHAAMPSHTMLLLLFVICSLLPSPVSCQAADGAAGEGMWPAPPEFKSSTTLTVLSPPTMGTWRSNMRQ
jgi:hypothetical protein